MACIKILTVESIRYRSGPDASDSSNPTMVGGFFPEGRLTDVDVQAGSAYAMDVEHWRDAFLQNQSVADQNLDGEITPADFTAWINSYNQGCP